MRKMFSVSFIEHWWSSFVCVGAVTGVRSGKCTSWQPITPLPLHSCDITLVCMRWWMTIFTPLAVKRGCGRVVSVNKYSGSWIPGSKFGVDWDFSIIVELRKHVAQIPYHRDFGVMGHQGNRVALQETPLYKKKASTPGPAVVATDHLYPQQDSLQRQTDARNLYLEKK